MSETNIEPLDPDFQLSLPDFEGPLDLLLHLIRKHELEILDLPIAFVTERYLQYVMMMERLNLDVAAEYLVMAATLAHIKSKMLLPQEPEDQEDDELEEELDPRGELIRRLLEYQKYKNVAGQLGARGIAGRDVFPRGSDAPRASGPPPLASTSLFKLLDAFQKVLGRAQADLAFEIAAEGVSIQERMRQIVSRLQTGGQMSFEDLFEEQVTVYDLVVTFLALLEMAKRRLVQIYQSDPAAPIHLRSTVVVTDESGEERDRPEAQIPDSAEEWGARIADAELAGTEASETQAPGTERDVADEAVEAVDRSQVAMSGAEATDDLEIPDLAPPTDVESTSGAASDQDTGVEGAAESTSVEASGRAELSDFPAAAFEPLATDAFGADALGSDALGSDALGSFAAGSETLRSGTLDSDAVGSDAVGSFLPGSDALSSDALSSDALSSDVLSSDALSSDALGSDALGSSLPGSDALGSDALGSDALGSDALGSLLPGSDALGSDALGSSGSGGGASVSPEPLPVEPSAPLSEGALDAVPDGAADRAAQDEAEPTGAQTSLAEEKEAETPAGFGDRTAPAWRPQATELDGPGGSGMETDPDEREDPVL